MLQAKKFIQKTLIPSAKPALIAPKFREEILLCRFFNDTKDLYSEKNF